MAKKSSMTFVEDFAFYEQLWNYYASNRGKIRSRYNDLTKKFLAYNDRNENPDAFLRTPQFEALEMYVFIKEFMNNAHMFQMFDDWRNHRDKFSDVSYYTIHKRGQITLLDLGDEQNEAIFKQMKKYRESYPNYIYALTMGLGKTILMGTCIFYEFLLANKYPKDKRFCHNALVFAPDKTVLESLREIMTFDKTKVVPPEYARVLDANIKFHYLDESGTTLQTIDDSDFNIVISNNQKIIVKKKRKEDKPTDVLFGSDSLLADVYGDDDDSDVWNDATLMDNQRFKKLCRLPQLGVYVDEAHHLFGANLEKELRSGGANIFPQKWQTNYFPDEPDATIKEKIEHIGNKLPFEKKLNIVAGNGYFGKKKKEYTASKIVITKAMGTSDVMDWNLESITKRDIRVSDEVVKIMNRWNNEYLNISISEGKMGEPSEEELAQIEKFKKNGWI